MCPEDFATYQRNGQAAVPVGKEIDGRAGCVHLAAAFEQRAWFDLFLNGCLTISIHDYMGSPGDIRALNFIMEPERDGIILIEYYTVCGQSSFKMGPQESVNKALPVLFGSPSVGFIVTYESQGAQYVVPGTPAPPRPTPPSIQDAGGNSSHEYLRPEGCTWPTNGRGSSFRSAMIIWRFVLPGIGWATRAVTPMPFKSYNGGTTRGWMVSGYLRLRMVPFQLLGHILFLRSPPRHPLLGEAPKS
jgi:hypothetical protein